MRAKLVYTTEVRYLLPEILDWEFQLVNLTMICPHKIVIERRKRVRGARVREGLSRGQKGPRADLIVVLDVASLALAYALLLLLLLCLSLKLVLKVAVLAVFAVCCFAVALLCRCSCCYYCCSSAVA